MPRENKIKRVRKKILTKRHILKIRKALVKEANSDLDLLKNNNDLTSFHSMTSGSSFKIICTGSKKISDEIFTWMMKLLENNMAGFYKECEWGWDFQSKQQEMSDAAARYLIAFSDCDRPVAFSHFRFDMDDNVNVLYCYELQLESVARRQGLAKHMMLILESLCCSYNMVKVILTVFIKNNNAVTFFKSQGYELDETSPQNFSVNTFYYIMSKKNKDHSIETEKKKK